MCFKSRKCKALCMVPGEKKKKYWSTKDNFILRSYRLWFGGMVTNTTTPDVDKCLAVILCYFTLLTRLTCVGTNRTF